MKNKPLLSIIVPIHNESEILAKFIQEVTKACKLLDLADYQFLLVENGSSDDSWDIIQQYAKKDQRIIPVQNKVAGYGLAMISGLKKVTAPYALVFNVDFWDSRFIALAKVDLLGYDVINSSKLLPGSLDKRPFNRKAVTYLYNSFIRWTIKYPGTDTHGIKLMRVATVTPIVKSCKTRSGIFDSELMIKCWQKGLKILELPVEIEEIRTARFSTKRWLQTPKDIWQLYQAVKK